MFIGSGYITDVGMCGESGGILGMDKDVVVKRMTSHLPHKFVAAPGPCVANGVIFDFDTSKKRVVAVTPVSF